MKNAIAMVLSNVNILEAMNSPRLDAKTEKETKAMMEKIMRDTYVLAGLEPQLLYEQLDDITHDLRAGHPHLTFEEVRLACKGGVSGELGGPKRPSYASVMQWCEAYDRSAMTADCRKIRKERPKEKPVVTPEQGLERMKRGLPTCARRRWEDIRTDGAFRPTLIPHVSAQIYDWLGEEGVLRLSPEDRQAAVDKARNEVPTTTVWDAAKLEGEKASVRSRAKHYALETWMRKAYLAGESLTLPEVKRIYQ